MIECNVNMLKICALDQIKVIRKLYEFLLKRKKNFHTFYSV